MHKVCICKSMKVKVFTQWVSDSLQPHGLYPPGLSAHGILQARILEWVAIPFSRGSSQPRDRTQVYLQCRQILYHLSYVGSPRKTMDLTKIALYLCCFRQILFFLADTLAAAAKSLQLCPTLRPHRQHPTRLPHPWDSPGRNTGVGCHFLLH